MIIIIICVFKDSFSQLNGVRLFPMREHRNIKVSGVLFATWSLKKPSKTKVVVLTLVDMLHVGGNDTNFSGKLEDK